MAAAAGSRVSGLLGRSRLQLSRCMSSGAHGEEGSARMWKALTYFVALPGVGVSMLNVFLKSHHGEEERPEFVAYPHLRIRSKVNSLPLSHLGNSYCDRHKFKSVPGLTGYVTLSKSLFPMSTGQRQVHLDLLRMFFKLTNWDCLAQGCSYNQICFTFTVLE
uniref:Uncharacterized protein n=1 Tax=Ovis aries TaxID=9940 RepID=A0AC11EIC8_SHEEP